MGSEEKKRKRFEQCKSNLAKSHTIRTHNMKDRRRLCIDVIQLLNVEKTNQSSQTTHIHSVFITFYIYLIFDQKLL